MLNCGLPTFCYIEIMACRGLKAAVHAFKTSGADEGHFLLTMERCEKRPKAEVVVLH